jgi:hypothetical protein
MIWEKPQEDRPFLFFEDVIDLIMNGATAKGQVLRMFEAIMFLINSGQVKAAMFYFFDLNGHACHLLSEEPLPELTVQQAGNVLRNYLIAADP